MNDEMTELWKLMRRTHANEVIKKTVAMLAETVSEQEDRIRTLEALVPPQLEVLNNSDKPVPSYREDPNWVPASIESTE